MAEPLCDLSGGEMRSAPLAAILVEALRARATGELRVDAHGGTSRIYFRVGQPCGAQVFFGGFKPLGQFLLEEGWIDIEALDRSLAAVVEGRKQGEALVELGCLTREKLHLGLALHHQRHVRKLAEVTEGTYAFTPLAELPAWTDELRLSAHRAIVDALAAPPGAAVCKRILRRVPSSLGVRLRSGWVRYVGHFQLDAAEQSFVASLERPTAVDAALASGHLAEPRAHALVAALYLMGILVPAPLGGVTSWATPGPEIRGTPGPIDPASPGPGAREGAARPGVEATAGPRIGARPAALDRTPGAGAAIPAQAHAAERTPGPRIGDDEKTVAARPGFPFADRAMGPGNGRAVDPDATRVGRGPPPPPPDAQEEAAPAQSRRARMLQRAFDSIRGGEVLRRPHGEGSPGPNGHYEVVEQPRPIDWSALPPAGSSEFERALRERLAAVQTNDHFARLGVPRDADRETIKRAFFEVAKRFHPDRIPAAAAAHAPLIQEVFAALNASYQVLMDDARRERHLAELQAGRSAPNPAVREFEAEVAAAFQRRDFAAAQRILADALEIEDRPDLRAHLLWARQSERPETTAQVRAELERLVERHPRCASARYYLGVLARVAGETERAAAQFQTVLEIMPHHREARQELRLLELRKAENPNLRRR